MDSKNISVIIPAAGISKRFSSSTKKQFVNLNGKPLLHYCIKTFENNSDINEIVVATHPDDTEITEELLKGFKKIKNVIAGGKERHLSVRNAFNEVSENTDIVLIHDAARPFLNDEMIKIILGEFDIYKAVIFGIPIYDTIKRINTIDNTVSNTIHREKLWRAQTPQAFEYNLLKEIYSSIDLNSFTATDESKLAEQMGIKIKIIEGSKINLKITDTNDFKIAESFIKSGLA